MKRISQLAAVAVSILSVSVTFAQTPGEWKYTITTDVKSIPEDMRVNFPTVSFSVCRSAEDFATARAFSIQMLASSESRCATSNLVTQETRGTSPIKLRFDYACDAGKTLSGDGEAVIEARRFVVSLNSKYTPPVSDVETIKQTMRAQYVGPCKVKPDADQIKVEDAPKRE